MFQFRRFPSCTYLIQCRIPYGGFPHSEISGSRLICSSPKLIAAYHVLHRLLMPRHSPCALFSLTSSKFAPHVPHSSRQLWANVLNVQMRATSPLKFKPTSLGFEFVLENDFSSLRLRSTKEKSPFGSLLVELCRLIF